MMKASKRLVIAGFLSCLPCIYGLSSSRLVPKPLELFAPRHVDQAFPTLLDRRHVLTSCTSNVFVASSILLSPLSSQAAVTDETDTFADNWWSTPASKDSMAADKTVSSSQSSAASDEITIRIAKADLAGGGLGLELRDIEFRTNIRVYVKSVRPSGLGNKLGIQPDWLVVRVDNQSTERTNAEGVARMLQQAVKKDSSSSSSFITMTFRDPAVFRNKLQSLQENESVRTTVAPAGDTTQRNRDGSIKTGRVATSQQDQTVSVTQLVAPSMCRRGADTDDLLEISYVGRILETGQIFDGSAVKINNQGIPGRGNDVSIFFVLNKQPFGQFPPGWDVGMYGMCVGERRRIIIPPALAYGANGVPRRNIPPNATLQYDVSLVSLNGLATPQ